MTAVSGCHVTFLLFTRGFMQSSRGGEDAKRTQGYVKQAFRNSLVMPVVKWDVMLSILLILSVPLDSSCISYP